MNHEIHKKPRKIMYKNECYAIQGAVFELYRDSTVLQRRSAWIKL
jgi:hypothetical protein